MNCFYFGKPARALFGAFHAPPSPTKKPAVLLCNPFGEEAIRAHRIYRVLALRLARTGHPVLRFDYVGTGDSAGEAEQTNIEDWIESIALATAELRARSETPRVALLGLRLGATLAMLAANKHALDLQHLLLWDPVVDGAAYLRELASSHIEYMSDEMGTPYPTPRTDARGFPEESLGHPLKPTLVDAIAAIDLAESDLGSSALTIVTTKSPGDRFEARLRSAANAKWIATSTNVPWNSDAAVNSAVVPMDILEILMKRIEELS